ncbi:DUF3987 domain-containing protein [Photobacterium makurazakiensis]|uniref:DUF3987 domain-containing protein n=1 Tax=Photobacterium makurazakiensis TaxID=2910234 RepID=UPI003D0A58D4
MINLRDIFTRKVNKNSLNNEKEIVENVINENNKKEYKKNTNVDRGSVKSIPKLNDIGMYGLLQKAVNILCGTTEALPTSLAAEIMSWMSVSIPRGNVYLPYGICTTEARLNAIIVADTGEGKGIATRQFNHVRSEIKAISDSLYCPIFQGGLSTPEGLINIIRDKDTNTNEATDSLGSQLLVIEEEMASIFNLSNNSKNNFSSYFRGFFDGTPVSPLTKFNKISCKEPHVAFYGHITPKELISVVKSVDLHNGLLNRFPLFYARRDKSIPFPEAIPKELTDGLVYEFIDILSWVKAEKREMQRSDCFKKLWEKKYEYLRALGPEGSDERALLSRAAHYATMYSMIFAVMDKSTVINEGHLKAALAWIDYWHQSVKYIYRTESERCEIKELKINGEKILEVIKKEIKKSGKTHIGKTPITKAFSGKFDGKEINKIIYHLETSPNKKIKVERLPRNEMKISLL